MQKNVFVLCLGLLICLIGAGCGSNTAAPPAITSNAQTEIPEATRQKAAQAAAEQARKAAAEQPQSSQP